MGKLLEVFYDNRDVILRGLSVKLPEIVDLLREKGVYKEPHGLWENTFYLVVYNVFSHLDTWGCYAEFADALTEAGKKDLAALVRRAGCTFTTNLEDRNVIGIGSDVTLSCCLDEEYSVRWYKDQDELYLNWKFKFKDERGEHKLIIADIQEKDSGVYYCICGPTKTICVLKVEDCSFTTKLEDINIIGIGSDVTLSCSLDKKCDVRWYKDQEEIIMNDKIKFKDARWKHKLIIAGIEEEDSGVYSCECGTTKTRCILKVEDCSFTTKLEDRHVIGIDSDVTLSCVLDREFDVRWYKDEEEIIMNDKFKVEDEGCEHNLIIAGIQEEDSGVYSCECGTTKTRCILKVEDCSFITKLEDINVIGIGSDVTLSCCMDKKCDVQWYKDLEEIIMNDKFKFKDEQWNHQLIIAGIQEEDTGVYSCECGTIKTRCVLNVEANRFIEQLEDVTITAGQKLILACELNAGCQNLKWYKTNGDISYRTIITDFERADSNAHRYKLEINRVRIEDAGEYSCSNENVITTCHVTVKEIKELNIDTSLETTTLLHELSSAKQQLEVTEDELNKTANDVDQKESIIEKKEKEIEKLRAQLQKKEDTIKRKESELENKAHCIKELKDENQQLAESVKKLKSICKELESSKQLLAQMKEQIEKLEAEKKHMEGRVSSLESYIKNSIKQQQKVSEQLEEGNKQQQKVSEQLQESSKQQQKANKQHQKDNKEQKELLKEIKAKMEKSTTCSVS